MRVSKSSMANVLDSLSRTDVCAFTLLRVRSKWQAIVHVSQNEPQSNESEYRGVEVREGMGYH